MLFTRTRNFLGAFLKDLTGSAKNQLWLRSRLKISGSGSATLWSSESEDTTYLWIVESLGTATDTGELWHRTTPATRRHLALVQRQHLRQKKIMTSNKNKIK